MSDPVDASADPGELTGEPMPIPPLAGVLLVTTTSTGALDGDVWVGTAVNVGGDTALVVGSGCGTDVWTGFGGCVETGAVGHGLLGVDPCWSSLEAAGG